jgi:hypothetical protein
MIKLIRLISIATIFCISFLTLCSEDSIAQSSDTNTRWMIKEMVYALDSILKADQVKNLIIEFNAPNEVNTLLKAELIRSGYILFDDPNDGTSVYKLKLMPNLVVLYNKTSRNEGLRAMKGSVSVQLTHPFGALVISDLLEINESQKIRGDITDFEDGLWTMSKFSDIKTSRRSESFKRILEPVLIITSIAVTVFLLFNVRTQ